VWHSAGSQWWLLSNPPPVINNRSICLQRDSMSHLHATIDSSSAVPDGSDDSVPARSAEPSASYGRVIDREATFGHHFLQIAITECEAKIPSDTQDDDLSFKMTSLEQRWPIPPHARQSLSDRPTGFATHPVTDLSSASNVQVPPRTPGVRPSRSLRLPISPPGREKQITSSVYRGEVNVLHSV
jgi:hypothetical protein